MSNKIRTAYLQSALNLHADAYRDNATLCAQELVKRIRDSHAFAFDNERFDQSKEKQEFELLFWKSFMDEVKGVTNENNNI